MHKRDVLIAGGGLAGLGLAYQIKSQRPQAKITIFEKQSFPRPRAIAKVGESTVEIGSHYFAKHLGLLEHLRGEHLKKFGIRIFFGEPAEDFSEQDELGASKTFGIPTYQIDRGDLENHLHARLCEMGVEIIDGIDIESIDPESAEKSVQIVRDGESLRYSGAWLLDAAGRASLIKKQLKLEQKNEHKANAVWFRIDRRIEVDSWTDNQEWQARCMPQSTRWLSTNHLVGPGYWVWIIPLASGVTSIGIVMDDQCLHESGIECQQSSMRWLHQNQAKLAQEIEGASFLDFVLLKDYSYSCKQLFSSNGWAVTGEAGLFADPFYSPGSDFIAISNCFIAELVCSSLDGEDIRLKSLVFEKVFRSIYDNTLSLYVDQYGGFGDRQMMGLKLLWDYSYYWGVLSLLFFRDALADIDTLRRISPMLQEAQSLNQKVQMHFRQRAQKRQVLANRGVFMDQYKIPCLQYFNEVLMADANGDVESALKENMAKVASIAESVIDMLGENPALMPSDEERALLGDYRGLILG